VTKNLVTDFSPPIGMDWGTLCGVSAGGSDVPVCACSLPPHPARSRIAPSAAYQPLT
jgi:hypothetical protein